MRLAFIQLPRFPVQRKVQEVPALAGKPFALVEDSRGQRRVAWASGSALKVGVRPGSTLTAACALEPLLEHFPFHPEAEEAALASLGEALLSLAPAFQLSTPEGLWLDASAAQLCGGEEAWLERVLEACAEYGWMAKACVASQAATARMLARHGARRVELVAEGAEARALGPLPLSALEGEESSRAALVSLGLNTLGEVAALPPGAWVARAGADGKRVHALCRGEERARFVPHVLPEVLEEKVALDWPAESLEPLVFAIKTALDRVGARLSGRKRAAVRLCFTLLLDPSGTCEVTLSLARPTSQSKLLLDLARHRLSEVRLENPVTGLRVRVDEACDDPGQQLALGDGPQGDAALEVVLSRLATTLGEDTLSAATVEERHRPEAASGGHRFRPPEAPRGMLSELLAETAEAPERDDSLLERPARLLTQPSALEAELNAGGELLSGRVLGRRRRVVALSGPERLGGEWWAPTAFSRDYYRVLFEGIGPAWVFRDGRDGRFYLQGFFD